VYYSRRWRWALGIMAVIGLRLIRQRRWGIIASIGIIVSRIWRYARQHEPATPALTPVHIYDARIPAGFDGFTIGQISDIHLGQPFSDANLRWAITTLNASAPDIIVLTGDLVNDRPAVTRLPDDLRQLRAPYGVYAITRQPRLCSKELHDVAQALQVAGIPSLRNQGFMLNHHGDNLWVAGIDDWWHGQMRIDRAIADAPAQTPVILLAHAPDAAFEASTYPQILLQLAGHVHGGHLNLPGLGPLSTPALWALATQGTQRINTMWLHISLGLSGRQLRMGSRPEVGIIHLHAQVASRCTEQLIGGYG
jgi:predicted MPP superfamily phosphohydrolase